jgi:hypothetical protein
MSHLERTNPTYLDGSFLSPHRFDRTNPTYLERTNPTYLTLAASAVSVGVGNA